MASVNKVIIVGNLGNDPESKFMPNGDAVCNISVATTDSWKDKNVAVHSGYRFVGTGSGFFDPLAAHQRSGAPGRDFLFRNRIARTRHTTGSSSNDSKLDSVFSICSPLEDRDLLYAFEPHQSAFGFGDSRIKRIFKYSFQNGHGVAGVCPVTATR